MTAGERKARLEAIAKAVRLRKAAGVHWGKWSQRHGFGPSMVAKVVQGRLLCVKGQALRIAEALGVEPPAKHKPRPRPEPESTPKPRPSNSPTATTGPPLPLPGWDDTWPLEHPFQAVALYLIHCLSGQTVEVLDTSKLSTSDNWSWSVPGAPDIVACVSGLHVEIELKTHRGRQTSRQESRQERVENACGKYVVCRTMREVFEALSLEVPE